MDGSGRGNNWSRGLVDTEDMRRSPMMMRSRLGPLDMAAQRGLCVWGVEWVALNSYTAVSYIKKTLILPLAVVPVAQI